MNTYGRWAHLRAALIAMHLLAITLMALPNPGSGLQRSAWKDPTVQQEFGVWRGRLAAVGWAMDPDEFEQFLWSQATRYHQARKEVLSPFDWYYRYFGTWQSWRMFVAPHRFPARLEIQIDAGDGAWKSIYVARSPTYTWNREQFDHERFRAAVFRYGWPAYKRTWSQFAVWAAGRVFDDYPDAQAVRLRFYKYRSLSPAEVLDGKQPEGRYINPRIIRRAAP
jgi:hypothetical protein